ncbi:hypothetical protein [Microbacterium flavum]|uniref:DUF2238 domain-containing protein n=1 Tax=Microbacterium flavum TaxID=415216 RepID=A0ABS5XQF3_9MICO|nr:hypothetical protein [Microbacterium flavum]MBT8796681.1 hypothetical protein [Microbacterium flavum]
MKHNFLRRPRGAADLVADGVRVAGILSVLFAAVWLQPTDAGILAFALPALMVPRFLGLRAGVDIVTGIVILLAAWSNVVDLYALWPAWDIPMHMLGTAVLTVAGYVALARLDAVPDPRRADRGWRTAIGTILVATAIGLALSTLWEMVEWAGWRFISDAIHVDYEDTIGDLAAGGLGAAAAGVLLGRVPLVRSDAR